MSLSALGGGAHVEGGFSDGNRRSPGALFVGLGCHPIYHRGVQSRLPSKASVLTRIFRRLFASIENDNRLGRSDHRHPRQLLGHRD